jgi:hypothetical protein
MLICLRLAAYIFKVDNYLSILRSQPPLLTLQDLHFPRPGSFSIWNTDGLPEWERRMPKEPVSRSRISMADFVKDKLFGLRVEEDVDLVEDIQLCLVASQHEARQILERKGSSSLDPTIFGREERFKKALEAMKSHLDRMSIEDPQSDQFGDEANLPLRYYFGYEEKSDPEIQIKVSTRAKTLIFDSLMLYHLLSLNLHSDIHTAHQVVKDRDVARLAELSESRQRERENRICSTIEWTTTICAKRALYHAGEVLSLYQNLALYPNINKKALDPISYIALCSSALVVWVIGMFGPHQCSICMPSSAEGAIIDEPPEIEGVPMCVCRVTVLVNKFYAHIPDGWEHADSGIAVSRVTTDPGSQR